jgi:hypothetical protein
LDKLGEPHSGIVVGHIGWVIAGVHDPDGIEIRLYTVERYDGRCTTRARCGSRSGQIGALA